MIYADRELKCTDRDMDFGTIHQITMGEHGRGRRLMALTCPDGTALKKGENDDFVIGMTKSGKPRINEGRGDSLYMLLSSKGGYTRRGDGTIQVPAGKEDEYALLMTGNGADGAAGRIGTWDCALIKAPENGIIRVRSSGAGYGTPSDLYLINEGKVYHCEPQELEDLCDSLDIDMPCTVDKEGNLFSREWKIMDRSMLRSREESQQIISSDHTERAEAECCRARRAELKNSRDMRRSIAPQLEALNARLEKIGRSARYDTREKEHYKDGSRKKYYSEDNLKKETEAVRDYEKREAADKAYAEWKPEFEAFADNAMSQRDIEMPKDPRGDSAVRYYQNTISVWDAKEDRTENYSYSEEGFRRFSNDFPELVSQWADVAEQKRAEEERARRAAEAERQAAEQKTAAEAEAKAMGLPSDVRIWNRTGAATNQGHGWVITPEGTDRPEDRIAEETRCGDGYQTWDQILPGELVLEWSHAYTAAPHEFNVVFRPEKITEAQAERAAEIQNELEEYFKDKRGLASGKRAPSVGDGWGLQADTELSRPANEINSAEYNQYLEKMQRASAESGSCYQNQSLADADRDFWSAMDSSEPVSYSQNNQAEQKHNAPDHSDNDEPNL